jgi:hypothetical protein
MVQKAAQNNGRRKRGQRTPQGQQRQIAARVSNGVRFQNPVLPGVESEREWQTHLASLEEALQPVGAWERLCVYRIALSAWKHFRLVRHELALVSEAVANPANEYKTTYDVDYVHAGDVAEVLERSQSSLEAELSRMRDLVTRVRALSKDGEGVTFTAIERRAVLSAIIEQSHGSIDDDEGDCESEEEEEDRDESVGETDTNGDAAQAEDVVIIPAVQLREEIGKITTAKGTDPNEAIRELADTMANEIKNRGRRLQLTRTHIGVCLVPDERNVSRLALYERQLDAASRRYLNDLYRAQALRLGQPVAAPIAVDVNVVGETGNGLHG